MHLLMHMCICIHNVYHFNFCILATTIEGTLLDSTFNFEEDGNVQLSTEGCHYDNDDNRTVPEAMDEQVNA